MLGLFLLQMSNWRPGDGGRTRTPEPVRVSESDYETKLQAAGGAVTVAINAIESEAESLDRVGFKTMVVARQDSIDRAASDLDATAPPSKFLDERHARLVRALRMFEKISAR